MPYATFSAVFAENAGRAPTLPESRFRHVVTPDHFIAVRKLPGGPAPEALAESLGLYREGAKALRSRLAAHAQAQSRAEAALADATASYGA